MTILSNGGAGLGEGGRSGLFESGAGVDGKGLGLVPRGISGNRSFVAFPNGWERKNVRMSCGSFACALAEGPSLMTST